MIRPSETVNIPAENPFQNDILNREIHADNLEKIIKYTHKDLVISIDAGWGKGKTTFIKMWKQKLDNLGEYQTLYFNAWENDDTDDPLVSLMVDMEEELPKPEPEKFNKIKETGKAILKKAIPTAMKIATHGILDIKQIDLGQFTEDQLVDLAGNLGSIELEKHKSEKQGKQKFKEALTNYQQGLHKKIIFFIDELDRCKPTFAIETLEKIKHLFNIDGYIFIISLDMSQLMHCVEQFYGQGIDSTGYLRRFIDLEYTLPEPDRELYFDFLSSNNNMKNKHTELFLIPYLKGLLSANNLSLRDINKLVYYLSLILPMTDLYKTDQNWVKYYLQAMGIIYSVFPILKFKENSIYKKFITGDYDSSFSVSKIIPFNPEIYFKNIYYRGLNSNFITIVNKLILLNLDVHNGDIKDLDNYSIRDDIDFGLSYFLDQNRRGLNFIRILEFADNFNIQD